jgi:hypothetical protein
MQLVVTILVPAVRDNTSRAQRGHLVESGAVLPALYLSLPHVVKNPQPCPPVIYGGRLELDLPEVARVPE